MQIMKDNVEIFMIINVFDCFLIKIIKKSIDTHTCIQHV